LIIFVLSIGLITVSSIAIERNNQVYEEIEVRDQFRKELREITNYEQAVISLRVWNYEGNTKYEGNEIEMSVYKGDSFNPILLGIVKSNEFQSMYVGTPLYFELNINSTEHFIKLPIVSNLEIDDTNWRDFNLDHKNSFVVKIDDVSHFYDIQVYLIAKNNSFKENQT